MAELMLIFFYFDFNYVRPLFLKLNFFCNLHFYKFCTSNVRIKIFLWWRDDWIHILLLETSNFFVFVIWWNCWCDFFSFFKTWIRFFSFTSKQTNVLQWINLLQKCRSEQKNVVSDLMLVYDEEFLFCRFL